MSQDGIGEAELPLEGVGARLARKREEAGLSRADLAERTRIPERHLAAIEAGDFAALPARTYAVGFTRSYAKALGLDDAAVADEVRAELAALEPDSSARPAPAFEPGDPARVPGPRFAWLAALGALAAIAVCFVIWRGFFAPAGELPSILPSAAPPPPAAAAPAAAAAAPAPAGGAVVFTARADRVWVKFTDAAGNQLLQKELAAGESYTVPADAAGVLLATARPDALAITVGGRPVPPLADRQTTLRNVPVTAAALLARGQAPAAPAVSAPPAPRSQPRAAAPAPAPSPAPPAEPAPATT